MMPPTAHRCELPRTPYMRTSQNPSSTHSGEYCSNLRGAPWGCLSRYRRGQDPGPEWCRRYNAFPEAPTERSGWVLGEDRNTNAHTEGLIMVLLADDHTMFREGLA